jgi:hypothetical protein
MGYNLSNPLDQARTGRVLAKRNMGPHLVVIGGGFHKESSKVVCVERDQMIRALTPDRSDHAFRMSVLPGRAVEFGVMAAHVQVSRTPTLTRPAMRSCDRRSRSAKARNRGG